MRHKIQLIALISALLFLLLPLCKAQAEPFEGIIYEVFVRAFADSDGDGIGDLSGLTAKLDHVAALGAKALWLMPVFPSPTYHGYDVVDYRAINPQYGTMRDFQTLLQEAHARGMKVLLDIPFNHTSSQHPWFIASKDESSPYRNWYHWAKPGEKDALLNQTVWDSKPWKPLGGAYYYALFWDGMPDLNFDNPDVVREVIDIAKYWLDMGVDGFRLDASSHIFATAERGPRQDIPASAAFWQTFYREIKTAYPNAYLMAEAWEPAQARAQLLTGFDSVVNFDVGDRLIPLLKQGGSGAAFVRALQRVYEAYEKASPGKSDAPFLSNHDQVRVFAALGYREEKAALAARVLLTLPGNPIIYYGEEIGMAGAKPDEELRTPMIWGEEDPALTRWRVSRYNKRTQSVAQQQDDGDSLLKVYQDMASLRNEHPVLSKGRFAPYDAGKVLMAWTMTAGEERLLVIHNPSSKAQQLSVPEGAVSLRDGSLVEGTQSMDPYASLLLCLPEDKR